MKASDITVPSGLERDQGVKAALFIARNFAGVERDELLRECGLLAYEPRVQPRTLRMKTDMSYRRAGQ